MREFKVCVCRGYGVYDYIHVKADVVDIENERLLFYVHSETKPKCVAMFEQGEWKHFLECQADLH